MGTLKRLTKKRRQEAKRRLYGHPRRASQSAFGDNLDPLTRSTTLLDAIHSIAEPSDASTVKGLTQLLQCLREVLASDEEALAAAINLNLINPEEEELIREAIQHPSTAREESGQLTFPRLTIDAIRAGITDDSLDPMLVISNCPRVIACTDAGVIAEYKNYVTFAREQVLEQFHAVEPHDETKLRRLGMLDTTGDVAPKGSVLVARGAISQSLRVLNDSPVKLYPALASASEELRAAIGSSIASLLHAPAYVWEAEHWHEEASQADADTRPYAVPDRQALTEPQLWVTHPTGRAHMTEAGLAARDLPPNAFFMCLGLTPVSDQSTMINEFWSYNEGSIFHVTIRPRHLARAGQTLTPDDYHLSSPVPYMRMAERISSGQIRAERAYGDEHMTGGDYIVEPGVFYLLSAVSTSEAGNPGWMSRWVMNESWPV